MKASLLVFALIAGIGSAVADEAMERVLEASPKYLAPPPAPYARAIAPIEVIRYEAPKSVFLLSPAAGVAEPVLKPTGDGLTEPLRVLYQLLPDGRW